MDTTTEPLRADEDLIRRILSSLQERIGPQKYNAWFKHGTTVHLDDGHVKVSVPNPFVANWVEQHYQADLTEAVEEHTSKTPRVCVSIDPTLSGQCRKRDLDMQAEIVQRTTTGRARQRKDPPRVQLRHSLDEFVVGPSNQLAYSAGLQVCSGTTDLQQLFVHGPCGVGKTHLLQGICNQLRKQAERGKKPFQWRYVTGEQFLNEFVVAVRNKQGSEFRRRYRNLDVLAVDDVHFLASKRGTQEEFLHTFNAIDAAGKRIILASDTHPRLVGKMNEQLISRFMAGMVVKVDPPDRETRERILTHKARQMNLALDRDVIDYVALHIRGSVRELEGTLVKLSALSALENGPVTLDLARDALSEHLARTDGAITLGDIEAVVAAFFGITPADIHSSRRTRTVSAARMVAMFLARRHTNMSFPEIGRFMGKNHSSVVLATQKLERTIEKDGEIKWNAPAGTKSMSAAALLEVIEEQIQ